MSAADFPVRNGNSAIVIPTQPLDNYATSDQGARGTTAQRPVSGLTFGHEYYDTDLQEFVFWYGSAWKTHVGIAR